MENFIELKRSFKEIPKDSSYDYKADHNAIVEGLTGISEKETGWNDLFLLNRVIILAEAGTGKTTEIKEAAKKLKQKGKKAFFLCLENISSNFEISFEIGDYNLFKDWLASAEKGYFFLDSVDEARLKDPKEFKNAIKKFALELGDNENRTHIFITSRISEWRPKEDLDFIKERLPFIKDKNKDQQNQNSTESKNGASAKYSETALKDKPEDIKPSIFSLMPLDEEQVKIFSKQSSVQDTNVFLEAIKRADADIFCARPLDLTSLITYWKKNNKIGKLSELIAADIEAKLKERDTDRDSLLPLTEQEAKFGAATLAAALTFTKKNRILILESDPDDKIKESSVNAQNILTDWDINKIRALLQRPIFDQAVYGAVKFHHRSIREYLTAQWLYSLLEQKMPKNLIDNLFFKNSYGEKVIVPSMRPILSWLILFYENIRDKTADFAPEIFIQGGDPAALPIDIRKDMIKRFCKLYANMPIINRSFDISEVRRFASSDMQKTIGKLLETYAEHRDIANLLLKIIWQGKIEKCATKALSFATNKKNDEYTRIYAIRAIAAAGSKEHKNKLISCLIKDQDLKNDKIIGALIESFAPDILSIDNIILLLAHIKENKKRLSVLTAKYSLKNLFKYKLSETDIVNLIKAILPLLKQPPLIEARSFEISEQYKWLLSAAAIGAEKLVSIKSPKAFDNKVLEIISLYQTPPSFYGGYNSDKNRLEELVPQWRKLNHALFWFDTDRIRVYRKKKDGTSLEHWHFVDIYDHFWKFTLEDFDTILKDIRDKKNIDNRKVALSLSFDIYKNNGRGVARRNALKKAVSGEPELEKKLNLYLNPPPMSEEERKWKKKEASYKRSAKRQKIKEAKELESWRKWLQKKTSVLRDTSIATNGSIWNATDYLLEYLRNKRLDTNKLATANWRDIIPEFGESVAKAYRDGCIDYWRKYKPMVKSDGIKDTSSIPNAVIVGLSGIKMESEKKGWLNNLSEIDAEIAAKYAVKELNGFPDWIEQLYDKFPNIVKNRILTEIEWEFSKHDGDTCYYVLGKVSYTDWLKNRIAEDIFLFLKKYEPKADEILKHGLSIFFTNKNIDKKAFIKTAKTKISIAKSLDKKASWLAALMGIDAENGLKALNNILDAIEDRKDQTQLSMLFIKKLCGEKFTKIIRSNYEDYKRPNILLPLIKLMYKHIRIEDDTIRESGRAYMVKLRDDAEYGRNQLFNILFNIPGKETYNAIIDLAHTYPNKKAWCIWEAKKKAEIAAEQKAWNEKDIACFAKNGVKTPKTAYDLYELVCYMLSDLKADLEEGNDSFASILIKAGHETKYRKYIAKELKRCSKGRYNLAQEDELADKKKPDIHILGTGGLKTYLPIEIKIADKWTPSELMERLKNQLCGQYLRDVKSNLGIFLLIYRGTKKYWKHPDKNNKKLNFLNLLQLLEEEGNKIITKDNKIKDIKIIGIDLTKRNKKTIIKS